MSENTLETTPATAKETAAALFTKGYYCAESVLLALAAANGRETEGLSRMVSGFCGGMSRSDGMCGALLGAIAAFGMLHGRNTAGDDKTTIYTLTHNLATRFEQEFGAKTCSGVLGCNISTPEGTMEFIERELETSRCLDVTARTAGIAQELLDMRSQLKHPLL